MGYLIQEEDTYRGVPNVKEELRKAKKALCKAIEAYEEIEQEMYSEYSNKSRSRYRDRYDY